MNLREALRLAEQAGFIIQPVNRTGEIDVVHPSGYPRTRVNGRRKDATRNLEKIVRNARK